MTKGRRSLRKTLRAPAVGIPMVGLLGIATLPAPAQDAPTADATGRALAVVPTFSAQTTLTDNRFLTANDRQSSIIGELSPGLHVAGRTGRIQGQLDYALNGFVYSHGSGPNNLQNALDGKLHAEAVDNWLFIDAAANISQQSISAFGTQSPDPALQNANQSEVATYSLSPSLRGSLAGIASYDLRAGYQALHSDGFDAANSRTRTAALNLHSEHSASARLGWGLALTHEGDAYERSRSTVSDRASATLNLSATPELVFSLSAGREATNLASVDKESSPTWGVGLDWRPSERTHVSLERDKRFFGESHAAILEYRTPRTAWRYADTQDVSTPSATGTGSTQTAYDLLFAQYASMYPDPALRAQMVTAALARNGIGRGSLVNGGFQSSAPSLQRRQEFSVALNGLRTTTLLTAYQTRTSNLDPLASVTGDLSTQGTVTQRGLGATLSHRLTPQASATASLMLLKSTASATSLATDQRSLTLGWSTQLSAHLSLSLSARHTAFSSTTSPYHESAVIAGLNFLL